MWSYILSLPDQTTGKSCTSLSVHLQSLFNQNQQAWLLPRYLTFEFPYLYWQIMFSTLPCMLRSFFLFFYNFYLQIQFHWTMAVMHGQWLEWNQNGNNHYIRGTVLKPGFVLEQIEREKLYIIVMQLTTTTYHYLLYTMSTYNNPSYTILSKIYL